jgi:hypothetical protein
MPIIEGSDGEIPITLMCTPHMAPHQRRPPDYPPFVQVVGRAKDQGTVLSPATTGWDGLPQALAFRGAHSALLPVSSFYASPRLAAARPQFTGFAWLPAAKEADVDASLRGYVASGDAPIYLGFGSMPAPEPEKLLELARKV